MKLYLVLAVGIGGGLGAICRYIITITTESISKRVPMGILICNVLGSFLIGVISAYFIKSKFFDEVAISQLRLISVTGFLGGFTTFSSFSLDVLGLLQSGDVLIAIFYIFVSVLFAILATSIGFYLMYNLLH